MGAADTSYVWGFTSLLFPFQGHQTTSAVQFVVCFLVQAHLFPSKGTEKGKNKRKPKKGENLLNAAAKMLTKEIQTKQMHRLQNCLLCPPQEQHSCVWMLRGKPKGKKKYHIPSFWISFTSAIRFDIFCCKFTLTITTLPYKTLGLNIITCSVLYSLQGNNKGYNK